MYMNESLFIDFLNDKEILWVGINFAKAKFTRKGFDYPQEVLQHYFHDWNMMILNDQKKYDIRMSFRKPVMQYDLSQVTKINKAVKTTHILTNRIDIKDVMSDEDITNYMQQFQMPQSEQAFGLMLLVESFDTATKTAAIWVVIFRTATSEVVLCEKFLKVPSGFGTRSYWARTIYNLLFDIQSSAFLRWENMVQNHIDETSDLEGVDLNHLG